MPFPYQYSTFDFACEERIGFVNSNGTYEVGAEHTIVVCGYAPTDTVTLDMLDYAGTTIRTLAMSSFNGVYIATLDLSVGVSAGDYLLVASNQNSVKVNLGIAVKSKEFVNKPIEILGSINSIKLGEFYKVFCRCEVGVPVLELKNGAGLVMDPYSASSYNSTSNTYLFEMLIGELGEISSTGKIWQDGFFVFKVTSSELTEVDLKPVQLVRPEDWPLTPSVSEEINEVYSKEAYIKM